MPYDSYGRSSPAHALCSSQQRLAEFTWRPSYWWGPCKDSRRCDAPTDRKVLGWNLISRRKESQTLRRRAQSLQKQPEMNVDQQLTGCLFLLVSSLPLFSGSSPPSSSCLWSPEEFRLWAPGDHEEAAGETGSQHLWFRGGVFWRRQHPLSSTWPPPSLPPSFLLPLLSFFHAAACCFLALLILRRRPTTPSLWRSCGAGRNSSARLHETGEHSATFAWRSRDSCLYEVKKSCWCSKTNPLSINVGRPRARRFVPLVYRYITFSDTCCCFKEKSAVFYSTCSSIKLANI